MKHAGGVYAEKMVIALIIILLTTNFYPLSRRLPASAFVDNSFYLLLPRNMFSMSNNSLDLYSFSASEHKVFVCACLHGENHQILVFPGSLYHSAPPDAQHSCFRSQQAPAFLLPHLTSDGLSEVAAVLHSSPCFVQIVQR